MAKTMKKITHILIEPDSTGLAYGKCTVAYIVGSSDDGNLQKTMTTEYTLAGQDLTDATAVFNNCKAKAELDEGI